MMFSPTSSLAALAVCLASSSTNVLFLVDSFAPRHPHGRRASTIESSSSSSSSRSRISTSRSSTCSHGGAWEGRRAAASRRLETGSVVVDLSDGPSSRGYPSYDPLNLGSESGWVDHRHRRVPPVASSTTTSAPRRTTVTSSSSSTIIPAAVSSSALSLLIMTNAAALLVVPPPPAHAASLLSQGEFNPDTFRPVCAASDSFYRLLQSSTRALVGDDNFSEYGPLIAGGLLRIRLELCVVESFFNEAVGPFISQNGLNWILPLHETVETFLAGSIFALATTFILVGSTKLIQIIAFYGDLVLGGPCRLFGGFFFDRARGMPVTLDVSFFGFWKTRLVGPPLDSDDGSKSNAGPGGDGGGNTPLVDFEKVRPADVPLLALSGAIKVVGETSKIFREFIEGLDLFVGRYLVLIASGYIIVKVIHFKVFPDFP